VTIRKRAVALASGSATKAYDGTPLTLDEVTQTGDGCAAGEGFVFTVTGSQTVQGATENLFTYTVTNAVHGLGDDALLANYDISATYGRLEVTAGRIRVNPSDEGGVGAVRVAGHEAPYDGAAHGITVDASAIADAVVTYAAVEAGPFGPDPVEYADVVVTTVWYRVEAPNFDPHVGSTNVTIRPFALTDACVAPIADVPFTGSAHEPAVSVSALGRILTSGEDYEVSYEDNISIGQAAARIVGRANFTGTVVASFAIRPIGEVGSGSGSVSAPKAPKIGKKATWRATPTKGSVFSHWEGTAVAGLSVNERRNPVLTLVVTADLESPRAVFTTPDGDRLSSLALSPDVPFAVKRDIGTVYLTDDSSSLLTVTVRGLPSGLKFNTRTLALTGAPKKGGVYSVRFDARNASGYRLSATVVLNVTETGNAPEVFVAESAYVPLTVVVSSGSGTASGSGVYLAGSRKVAVRATPAKGWFFDGWYADADGHRPYAFASGGYRDVSQTVLAGETRYVFARFVEKRTPSAWETGTFDGVAQDGDGSAGWPVNLSVSKAGVVSGKTKRIDAATGKTVIVSLSAPGLIDAGTEDVALNAVVEYKDGKSKRYLRILFSHAACGAGTARVCEDQEHPFTAVQNGWKRTDLDFPAFPTGHAALTCETDDGLTLKCAGRGAVSYTGKIVGEGGRLVSVSGSSQLLVTSFDGSAMTADLLLFVTPRRDLPRGFSRVLSLDLECDRERGRVTSVAVR